MVIIILLISLLSVILASEDIKCSLEFKLGQQSSDFPVDLAGLWTSNRCELLLSAISEEDRQNLTYLGYTRQLEFERVKDGEYKLSATYTVHKNTGCLSDDALYRLKYEYTQIVLKNSESTFFQKTVDLDPLVKPLLSLITIEPLSELGSHYLGSLYSHKIIDFEDKPVLSYCRKEFANATNWILNSQTSLLIRSTEFGGNEEILECQPPVRKLPGHNLANQMSAFRIFNIMKPDKGIMTQPKAQYLNILLSNTRDSNEIMFDEPLERVSTNYWPKLDFGFCTLRSTNMLKGTIWTSWYCEPGPFDSWITRTLHFSNDSFGHNGWEMRHTEYFDPDCSTPKYALLIQGLYHVLTLNEDEIPSEEFTTSMNSQAKSDNGSTCGNVKDWKVDEPYDLAKTNGCEILELVLPQNITQILRLTGSECSNLRLTDAPKHFEETYNGRNQKSHIPADLIKCSDFELTQPNENGRNINVGVINPRSLRKFNRDIIQPISSYQIEPKNNSPVLISNLFLAFVASYLLLILSI